MTASSPPGMAVDLASFGPVGRPALAPSASFHPGVKIAPSKPGIEHQPLQLHKIGGSRRPLGVARWRRPRQHRRKCSRSTSCGGNVVSGRLRRSSIVATPVAVVFDGRHDRSRSRPLLRSVLKYSMSGEHSVRGRRGARADEGSGPQIAAARRRPGDGGDRPSPAAVRAGRVAKPSRDARQRATSCGADGAHPSGARAEGPRYAAPRGRADQGLLARQ